MKIIKAQYEVLGSRKAVQIHSPRVFPIAPTARACRYIFLTLLVFVATTNYFYLLRSRFVAKNDSRVLEKISNAA